jgi:hypothetical protein
MCALGDVVWMQLIFRQHLKDFLGDSPNIRGIRRVFRGSRFTATIMAYSLSSVRKVRELPAFTSNVDVTISVSRKRCPSRQKI